MKYIILALVSLTIFLQSGTARSPDDRIKSRMNDMVAFLEEGDTKSFIEMYFHPLIVESLEKEEVFQEHGNNPNGAGLQELISHMNIALDLDLAPEYNTEGNIATFRYEERLMSVALMKHDDDWYLIFVNG